MAAAGRIGEAMLWRVLSRSHWLLFALAAVAMLSAARAVLMDTSSWPIAVAQLRVGAEVVFFGASCYLVHRIACHPAIRLWATGGGSRAGKRPETEAHMQPKGSLEKFILVLAAFFLAFAIVDAVLLVKSLIEWHNPRILSTLAMPISSLAQKIFFAVVLYTLAVLLSQLRSTGEGS